MAEEAIDAVATTGFAALDGEEKKEVIVALTFGFFAVEVAMSPALRLRGVAMVKAERRSQLNEGRGFLDDRALDARLQPRGLRDRALWRTEHSTVVSGT